MTASPNAVALIKRFEGFCATSYRCPAGVLTIGYGHTRSVTPGMRITQAEAETLLKDDLSYFDQFLAKLIKVPVNQNQYDALVSFTFNVGVDHLYSSTLLKKLNAGDHDGAADEFSRWTFGGGKKLPGLLERRKAEAELFRRPVNG